MDERYIRRYVGSLSSSPTAVQGRMAGILIAIPFVVCFSMFGIFNLVGGTILIIIACRSKLTPRTMAIIQRLMRKSNIRFDPGINSMQVVGIILLLTGSLLVIIGLTLGVIACRSVNEHQRRRNDRLSQYQSGIPLYSMTERSNRRPSSLCSTSLSSSRSRNEKKSFMSEKTVSPILEVNSEEEISDNSDCGATAERKVAQDIVNTSQTATNNPISKMDSSLTSTANAIDKSRPYIRPFQSVPISIDVVADIAPDPLSLRNRTLHTSLTRAHLI